MVNVCCCGLVAALVGQLSCKNQDNNKKPTSTTLTINN
jgi:hypothetical protein